MDKLKPILAHKFWILFALALLLPTIGWWSTTGALMGEITERTNTIQSAFSNVPNNEPKPNDDWTNKLKDVNNVLQQQYNAWSAYLAAEHQKLRVWPSAIADKLEGVPYFGDIPIAARDAYRITYFDEMRRVWYVADPHIPAGTPGPSGTPVEARPGRVLLSLENIIPRHPSWPVQAPNSKVMWECQEDLWLFESILSAIAAVNADAASLVESPIKEVQHLELRGGTPGGGEPGSSNTAELAPGSGPFGFGSGQAAAAKKSQVELNLAEIFGSDAGAADPSDGGEEGGTKVAPRKRYVHDDPNLPFRTRGFYLKVRMQNHRLPDLQVHLSNLKWPVQILRVQQAGTDTSAGASGSTGGGRPTATRPTSPRPVIGPNTVGRNFGNKKAAPPDTALEEANADRYLVDVAIAGLIYIYLPLPDDPNAPSAAPASGDPTQIDPDTGEPLAAAEEGDAAAADPTTDPNAQPTDADPQPSDPATAPAGSSPDPTDPNAPTATPGAVDPAAAPESVPESPPADPATPGDAPPAAAAP